MPSLKSVDLDGFGRQRDPIVVRLLRRPRDRGEHNDLASLLDEEEAERIERLLDPLDRQWATIRQAWVRMILAHEMGTDPRSVRILRSCPHCGDRSHGKPVAAGGPHFSTSSCRSVAALVTSRAHPMGIDVEEVDAARAVSMQDLWTLLPAGPWFAPMSEPDRGGHTRAWTAVEAVLKAAGLGLAGDVVHLDRDAAAWQISEFSADGIVGSVVAVTADRAIVDVDERDLDGWLIDFG